MKRYSPKGIIWGPDPEPKSGGSWVGAIIMFIGMAILVSVCSNTPDNPERKEPAPRYHYTNDTSIDSDSILYKLTPYKK